MKNEKTVQTENVQAEKNIVMRTDNLKVYRIPTSKRYEVSLNDKKQIIDDRFLLLSQKDAFDLELEQLMFVPFQVGIKREFKSESGMEADLGEHAITIIEFYPKTVVTSFMIFGPRDDNDAIYSNTKDYEERRQLYFKELYKLVKEDERFNLPEEYQESGEFNLEAYILAETTPGIKYSQYGPFEFMAEIKAKTFGEFCLIAEKISYELDNKATKAVLALSC